MEEIPPARVNPSNSKASPAGSRAGMIFMNTLIFLAGCGTGSFVTIMLILRSVANVNKMTSDRSEKHAMATERLLAERNELDKIANSLLATIANNIAAK